jgi:zinc/manganese transport system substrate-binding protein
LVLALNRADMLVFTGLELEVGWLPNLITGSRNPRIQPGGPGGVTGFLDASTVIPLKQVPLLRIDRSMGDIHPGGNPHYMSDPNNGARVALSIADRLSIVDPANRAAYRKRAQDFQAACQAFSRQQVTRFGALPETKRQVVVYHQSLIYLVEWLGLEQVNTLEPKPGIPPSPGHVAQVLSQMRTVGVEAILQEEFWPTTISQLLAAKTQARVAVLPGGPDFDKGQTYLGYVKELADKVYAGVKS